MKHDPSWISNRGDMKPFIPDGDGCDSGIPVQGCTNKQPVRDPTQPIIT